ncbi:hypothetical protein AAC387_Pa05g3584 [Persea americana]
MGEETSLLDFWVSPFGMRVRLALAEKGLCYQLIEESLMTIERSPLLLKMNPVHKKIPVLIHRGRPICESLNIVQYIDEFWNDRSPLLPQDPYQRANARFWADFIDKKVYSSISGIWKNKGEGLDELKKDFIETFKEELPGIAAWARRCRERESVSKVLPEPSQVYDAVCQARKLQGIY